MIDFDLAAQRLNEGLKAFFKRAVQFKVLGFEHHPGVGAPPQNGLPMAEPGENAQSIGLEQSFGGQVTARSQQTWCISAHPPCMRDRWKHIALVKPG